MFQAGDDSGSSTFTVVQQVRSPVIPDDAQVTTVLVNHPPGAPGYPPHRLPGGPAFGYMIAGEMVFELEGEAPRVLRAGDAFWAPGGHLIHYQDANHRTDIPCSFVLTILCAPGRPMLERVSEAELRGRRALGATHTGVGATAGNNFEAERRDHWREATNELVLAEATAVATTGRPQTDGSISITLTGQALSTDLLLADIGSIALTSIGNHADTRIHSMRVVPMRLDALSNLPVVHVSGRDLTEPTQLGLVVELTARNPHTGTTSVMTCEFESVSLDPQTPAALLDFQLQHVSRQSPG